MISLDTPVVPAALVDEGPKVSSALTAPEPASPKTWSAHLALRFSRAGERTFLSHVEHRGPLRIQKTLYPEGPQVCHGVLLHPPGGIAGGDTLAINVHAQRDSRVLITTPGATKWYRTGGQQTLGGTHNVRVHVEAGAVVEWLPQENIFFNGARASILSNITLEQGGAFLGVETLCFGRRASGERFESGSLRLAVDLTLADQPLWHERGCLVADSPLMHSPIGLAGFSLCSTVLAAGPMVDEMTLAACRQLPLSEPDARCGFTVMPNLFIGRYLGHSSEAARHWFLQIFEVLRPALFARAAITPRIWLT